MQITSLTGTGTVAIVTGASSGIGEATALRLAEHAAAVAVVARRKKRLAELVDSIESAGGTALAVDITDRAQAQAAVQTVVDTFGRLDILVNNAGLMLLGNIVDADIDEWDQMIAVNQQGLLYRTHAALPHLLTAARNDLRASPTSSTSPPSRAVRHRRTSASST